MGGTGDTRRGLRVLVLSFLLTALLRLQAEALYIQVDVHQEECFFEQGIMGNNMTLNFQVMEGGFLDIDVEIRNPKDDVLLQRVRQTTGHSTIPVRLAGFYQFCFSNHMSTLTRKEVMFTIDPGQAPAASTGEEKDPINKLGEMVRELEVAVRAIKRQQRHVQVRQKTHRIISENTNCLLTVWTFFEASILVIMTFGHMYYLRSFFQATRPRTGEDAAA